MEQAAGKYATGTYPLPFIGLSMTATTVMSLRRGGLVGYDVAFTRLRPRVQLSLLVERYTFANNHKKSPVPNSGRAVSVASRFHEGLYQCRIRLHNKGLRPELIVNRIEGK